jgi:hypothetical protein
VAAQVSSAACGPSFEAIQEGDLRFAHCDRLDLDANISPSHRLHCWREWRRVYTYGQTRDRVEYAQRRIAEVVSGDVSPAFELPPGERRRGPNDARQTPRLNPTEVAAPLEAPSEAPSEPPAVVDVDPECRSSCEADQAGCAPGCETKPTGCQPCEPSIEACLEKCRSDGH